MDPLILGSAIGAPILGGIFGNALGSKEHEEALKMRQKALEEWKKINLPSLQDQALSLESYQNAGQLTPALEQSYSQGNTVLTGVQADPQVRAAQLLALKKMQNLSKQKGLSQEDKGQLLQVQAENARQEKAQRDAITQNMASRGLGGTGVELASKLQAQQSSANRNAQQSNDFASMAQKRALQALMGSGQLAGQLRGQEYNERAEAARAQDLIHQFNTRNQQAVSGQNIDRINQAHGFNLQNNQNIMNRNTEVSNSQQMHNKGLYQQQFDNQARIAAGVSGQYHSMANDYEAEAERKRKMYGGIGAGIGQAATAYGMFGGGR